MFATSLALAQESPKPAQAGAAGRAAMLATLQRGKQITVRNERYQVLPEVVAVARKSLRETPQQAIAALGADAGQIIETKGRFVLFRSSPRKAAMVEEIAGAAVYPAVLRLRTGTFGVLTGTLVVRPGKMADAAAIARSHGLETVKEYPHIQFVFYRIKVGADIADAAAALQADPLVDTAYPEIVEYVRVPK
jgi:hypothetical protein